MGKKVPTKDDWIVLKPTVSEWYKTRTANWITDELKRQGYNVTAKMLRDRFKDWGLDPKYTRHKPHKKTRRKTDRVPAPIGISLLLNSDIQSQQDSPFTEPIDCHTENLSLVPRWPYHAIQIPNIATPTTDDLSHDADHWQDRSLTIRLTSGPHGKVIQSVDESDIVLTSIEATNTPNFNNSYCSRLLNPSNPFFTPEPSRTPDTPQEDWHLQHTLSEVYRFLDRIVRNKSWLEAIEEPCFELQRLASNAHLAVSSLAYDCHQIWQELSELQVSATILLPKFWKPCRNMHPRVLTILLRLLVEDYTKPLLETKTLEKVKNMIFFAAVEALGRNHPVTLLCGMPRTKSVDLLWKLIELVKVQFYAKARHENPTFVAREQIYSARVLASLGYPQQAEVELLAVIDDLATDADQCTLADAYRTLGFSKFHAAEALEAQGQLSDAQWKFLESSGESVYALEVFEKIGASNTENAMYTHHRLACTYRKLCDLERCEEHFRAALTIWESTRKSHERQGGVKLVRDLDLVLRDQGKVEASEQLRRGYPRYFDESPDASP